MMMNEKNENNATYSTNNDSKQSLNAFHHNIKQEKNLSYYTMDIFNQIEIIKYGYYNINDRKDRINPINNDNWKELVDNQFSQINNQKNYKKFFKYFIKDTNIVVLDFDNHTENNLNLDKIYEKFEFLKDCYYTISKSGKGFHFYVTCEEKYTNIKKEINCNPDCGFDIDYLTDIIEETENCELFGKELLSLTTAQIKQIYPNIDNKLISLTDIPDDIQQKIFKINNAELIELVQILHPHRAHDYNSWYKVCSALKSQKLKDEARKFSSTWARFTELKFEEDYSKLKELSVGVIFNLAKEDNFTKYQQIRNKYKYEGLSLTATDFDTILSISHKIQNYLKDKIKYCNKIWYAVKDNLWVRDIDPTIYIYQCIETGTQTYLDYIHKSINSGQDISELKNTSEKREKLLKARKSIDGAGKMAQIIRCLRELLADNDFENCLDKLPYRFAFKNGIYDVRKETDRFRFGIDATDYLTKTIPFDYKEGCDAAEWEYIQDQLYKLCNCDYEQMEYYMTTLAYCLCGDASKHQNFYISVGQSASNGKSTIVEALTQIMPNYVKIGNSIVLEAECKNKHKFLPELGKYRLITFEEMNEKKKLCGKTFKTIADGLAIENEVMYGTCDKIKITAKCMLNSNWTPEFDKPDEGVKRRYQHFQFDSQFSDKFVEDDYQNKKFIGRKDAWKDFLDRKETFMYIILEIAHRYYIHGFPKIPEYYEQEKEDSMEDIYR
jgi:phage/plasmid-associated DNA primase